MAQTKDSITNQWAPKIGRPAAELRRKSVALIGRSYWLNFLWIPSFIAAAKLHSLVLWAIGILTAVATIGTYSAGLVYSRRSHRLAGACLGLHFGPGKGHVPPPPREDGHYRAWCSEHGVTPYAAETQNARDVPGRG